MRLSEECEQYKTFKTRRKFMSFYVYIISNILITGAFSQEAEIQVSTTPVTTTAGYSDIISTTIDYFLETLNPNINLQFAEAVEYLNVTPISVIGRHGELQLNISWKLPEGKVPPKDYSIEVEPESSNGCISRLCYEFGIKPNPSWSLVPASHPLVAGTDCSIKPGCSYTIKIISHILKGKEMSILQVTLPECVGNVCSCTKGSKLPRPSVSVESHENTVNISWHLQNPVPQGVNVSHYMLSFAEQKVMSVYHKPWFVHNSVIDIPWNEERPKWIVLKINTSPDKKYLARLQLVDDKGCSGPTGNYTLQFSSKPVETNQDQKISIHLYWMIGCGIFIGSSLILLAFIKICKPHCRLKTLVGSRIIAIARSDVGILRRQAAWPPIYRNTDESQRTTSTTTTMHKFSEERSPLYVEKEIEEAIAKGEADGWEISPHRLRLGRQLGEGAFGRVYIAKTDIPAHPIVAVKKLKNHASADEVNEFLGEIAMLKVVGCHPNVVALVGCCTLKQPYCVLLQFAPRGDLLKHLRNLRQVWRAKKIAARQPKPLSSSYVRAPETRPSFTETEYTTLDSETEMCMKMISECSLNSLSSDAFIESLPMDPMSCISDAESAVGLVLNPSTLHGYALQIARGMEHLESKGITHRDLAARNVLIDETGTLKVSDLGLSRAGEYVHTKHRKVPLRWLALEAIKESRYSNKSDVWSYAVLLWEIGTLGGFPYPNLSDHQILGFLCEGKRLDRPEVVSYDLYSMMITCWKEDPGLRPTFAELVKFLDRDETKNIAYVDMNTLKLNYVFPPTEEVIKFNNKIEETDENEPEENQPLNYRFQTVNSICT